jgi:dTDP-4-dehydrorhamnose reductase
MRERKRAVSLMLTPSASAKLDELAAIWNCSRSEAADHIIKKARTTEEIKPEENDPSNNAAARDYLMQSLELQLKAIKLLSPQPPPTK